MSFALVLALPQMAVVAADTRLNIVSKDGSTRANDFGQATVRYKDGSVTTLGDVDRKIRGFPGGWVAGVGNLALVQSCLSGLEESNARTPAAVASKLQQVYQDEFPKIRAAFPDDDTIERTAIMYAYVTQTKFGVGGVSFTDEWQFPAGADFYTGAPPDLPAQDLEKARSTLRGIDLPANMDGVHRILRTVAGVFHGVSEAATSVSDYTDMALMLRGTGGVVHCRLLALNHDIMNASSEQMVHLISRVPR